MNESVLASQLVKTRDSVRGSKGFLFEAEDTPHPVLCRDVRGFPQALLAARDGNKPPGRLVIIVPELAMEDWIAQWAEDESRPRRSITITRRIDGQRLRLVGTLLSYGYGVETTIAIEKLEPIAASRAPGPSLATEPPPKSTVRTIEAPKAASRRRLAH